MNTAEQAQPQKQDDVNRRARGLRLLVEVLVAVALLAGVVIGMVFAVQHKLEESRTDHDATVAAVAKTLNDHGVSAEAIRCNYGYCSVIVEGRSYKMTVMDEGGKKVAAFPGDTATPPGF